MHPNFGHPESRKRYRLPSGAGQTCGLSRVREQHLKYTKISYNSHAVRSKWESPPEDAENDEAGKADLDWLMVYAVARLQA